MIKKLTLLTILISTAVIAPTVTVKEFTAQIKNQIISNKPDIDTKYADRIAVNIYKLSLKHGIPSDLYAAILMQESKYDLKAKNNRTKDYGIAQINWRTIKHYKFNKNRLMTDLAYSLEAGAIVLKDFMVRYSNEITWWSRYNSSKIKCRRNYASRVKRYLNV